MWLLQSAADAEWSEQPYLRLLMELINRLLESIGLQCMGSFS